MSTDRYTIETCIGTSYELDPDYRNAATNDPEELAEYLADMVADGHLRLDEVRVRIWTGANADRGTTPDAEHITPANR